MPTGPYIKKRLFNVNRGTTNWVEWMDYEEGVAGKGQGTVGKERAGRKEKEILGRTGVEGHLVQ